MSKTLDKFDIALLNLMQANNIATAEQLAREVPLSPSAITRRVRRLRESGFIAADISLLSEAILGHRLRAVVQVQLADHAETGAIAGLRKRLSGAREVQLCLEITGAFDLMLVIVTRDMAAFNAFADDMFGANPGVRRYEASFVKRQIRNAPAVWLDERDVER
jgi:Lrp/AsnC family leucine-responsive transcriptional regulator